MSRSPVVHQFTAVLAERDAVGHHTLAVDEILKSMGCETEIFAAHIRNEVKGRGRDFHDHPTATGADLIIYQASTGTPVADYLLTRPEPLVVNYHNITPASFFDPWEPHIAAELDHGRRQLRRLAGRVRMGIADSEFNAGELREVGFEDVVTVPVLFPDVSLASGGGGSGSPATVLFVGRLAPNKCQHDVVAAFAVLRELVAGTALAGVRLVLVGGSSSVGFESAVRGLVERLGLSDVVTFAGSVSDEELVGWYSAADVFLCLSEHEGFCVPLVEAMGAGVPVVAFGAAAVPETLSGAGVVLGEKSPVGVALAVQRVLSDEGLRARLVARGNERVVELGSGVAEARMREVLAPLLTETTP